MKKLLVLGAAYSGACGVQVCLLLLEIGLGTQEIQLRGQAILVHLIFSLGVFLRETNCFFCAGQSSARLLCNRISRQLFIQQRSLLSPERLAQIR
jgi:hypothetical protein